MITSGPRVGDTVRGRRRGVDEAMDVSDEENEHEYVRGEQNSPNSSFDDNTGDELDEDGVEKSEGMPGGGEDGDFQASEIGEMETQDVKEKDNGDPLGCLKTANET